MSDNGNGVTWQNKEEVRNDEMVFKVLKGLAAASITDNLKNRSLKDIMNEPKLREQLLAHLFPKELER